MTRHENLLRVGFVDSKNGAGSVHFHHVENDVVIDHVGYVVVYRGRGGKIVWKVTAYGHQ